MTTRDADAFHGGGMGTSAPAAVWEGMMVLNLNRRIRNAESFASLLDVDFEGRPLDLPLLEVARMAAGSDRGLYQRQNTPINWLVGLTGTLLHRLHRWCAPWLYDADSVLDFLDGEERCGVRATARR